MLLMPALNGRVPSAICARSGPVPGVNLLIRHTKLAVKALA